MDLTVGFVSRNLVTKKNFIEFHDGRIFHYFRGDGCLVDSKNEIFEKNLVVGK